MNSKYYYQEALDILLKLILDENQCFSYRHAKNGLQELVDNYERLEKALDKACKYLSDNNELPCYCDDFDESKPLSQCNKCNNEFVDVEKCWKEYFLKENKDELLKARRP